MNQYLIHYEWTVLPFKLQANKNNIINPTPTGIEPALLTRKVNVLPLDEGVTTSVLGIEPKTYGLTVRRSTNWAIHQKSTLVEKKKQYIYTPQKINMFH